MKTILTISIIALLTGIFSACQKEDLFFTNDVADKSALTPALKTGNYTTFLNNLISKVELLATQGYIKNSNPLVAKINAAIKSLDKENSKAANGQLNAFINQVEALMRNGELPQDKGQDLINDALKAIAGDFSEPWSCGSPWPDIRDGHAYLTVQIGSQCWMAENLNYLTENSWWYDDLESNGDIYGRLYTWSAALTACPEGWHLPYDEEWQALESYLGMSESELGIEYDRLSGGVGSKLKSASGWANGGNGTNESGFNALAAGARAAAGVFGSLGERALFWAQPGEGERSWSRRLHDNSNGVFRYYEYNLHAFSVRCLYD